MNGASEKHHAHELIERLPDSQIATAVRFLEFMLLDRPPGSGYGPA
jgi:hypothetical protein